MQCLSDWQMRVSCTASSNCALGLPGDIVHSVFWRVLPPVTRAGDRALNPDSLKISAGLFSSSLEACVTTLRDAKKIESTILVHMVNVLEVFCVIHTILGGLLKTYGTLTHPYVLSVSFKLPSAACP